MMIIIMIMLLIITSLTIIIVITLISVVVLIVEVVVVVVVVIVIVVWQIHLLSFSLSFSSFFFCTPKITYDDHFLFIYLFFSFIPHVLYLSYSPL